MYTITVTKEQYRDYLLNSSQYKVKRAAIWLQYKGICSDCYSKGEEVHHKTYARLGNEELSDLVLLCSKCHRMHHGLSVMNVVDKEIDNWNRINEEPGIGLHLKHK